jgi:hypothetical protein
MRNPASRGPVASTPPYLLKARQAVTFALLIGTTLLGHMPAEAATGLIFKRVDPADPAIAPMRQTGERAIALVADRLVSEVNQVLATKSPEEAIELLHLEGFTLPAAVPGSPVVIAIKRTSLRVRDPGNAPDAAEMAVLQSILRNMENGESPPKLLMQHVDASGGSPEEWRVYRPIGVAASCVVCHGNPESMPPAVKVRLDQLFPADKAVGYNAREWRGVIRVSVTAAPVVKP